VSLSVIRTPIVILSEESILVICFMNYAFPCHSTFMTNNLIGVCMHKLNFECIVIHGGSIHTDEEL
jgi:hypothetical protein